MRHQIGKGMARTLFVAAAAFMVLFLGNTTAYADTGIKLKSDEAYAGSGMSWDGKTLVLNNCSFKGQIKVPKNSTVVVQGTNNLVMDKVYDETGVLIGSGALTITGGGTLNVVNAVTTKDNCYCIVGKKELTIDNVTINASATATGDIDIAAGIVARKAIKITGSTINAAATEDARTSAGIRGAKSVYIGNSNIIATGGSFGIVAAGDALGISYSNVKATGGKAAIKAKTAMQLTGVSGGTVGEKNDRWYVMDGNDRATSVNLAIAN